MEKRLMEMEERLRKMEEEEARKNIVNELSRIYYVYINSPDPVKNWFYLARYGEETVTEMYNKAITGDLHDLKEMMDNFKEISKLNSFVSYVIDKMQLKIYEFNELEFKTIKNYLETEVKICEHYGVQPTLLFHEVSKFVIKTERVMAIRRCFGSYSEPKAKIFRRRNIF